LGPWIVASKLTSKHILHRMAARRVTETDERTGEVYEGHTADGQRHGRGRLTFPDGSSVEGRWSDGDGPQGPGVYRSADGTELRALFVDGCPEGPVRQSHRKPHVATGRPKPCLRLRLEA